jgi:hypothetical protein
MASPYVNSKWVTSAQIARCRIIHTFPVSGAGTDVGPGLGPAKPIPRLRDRPHSARGGAITTPLQIPLLI